MCKVLMFAGIKEKNVDNAWKFARAISKHMSRGNTDGLGYSAITAEGKLFGERWLTNDHAFKASAEENSDKINAVFGDAVESKVESFEYNSFGEIQRDKMVALTLHTRFATSARGMKNTHPFVYDDVSLIHNGVIHNDTDFDLKLSTCDSEAILISYLDADVRKDPANFEKAAGMLQGYYACGVLTTVEDTPILDIFKAHNDRLFLTWVNELETYVISSDDDNIKDTCKELGFSRGAMFKVHDGRLIRVNAVTGAQISITKFTLGERYKKYQGYGTGTGWSSNQGNGHTSTGSVNMGSKTEQDVYPFGKRGTENKSNVVPLSITKYKESGKINCYRLSEREIQEEVMEQERLLNLSSGKM